MKILLTLLLCAALIQPATHAGSRNDKEKCEKVKLQIRQIEAKMRNGYTASQGIRYDERLRKLKEKRYEVCR